MPRFRWIASILGCLAITAAAATYAGFLLGTALPRQNAITATVQGGYEDPAITDAFMWNVDDRGCPGWGSVLYEMDAASPSNGTRVEIATCCDRHGGCTQIMR